MKPEANTAYFTALFLCAAFIWLVGPLILSFIFDAAQHPTIPGKLVPLAQVKAVWNDMLTFVGGLGWVLTGTPWVLRYAHQTASRRKSRGKSS